MKKMTVGLMLCLVSAFGSGCLLVNSDDDKDDARRNVDRGSKVDYCDVYDWYGDGTCDDFCKNPDPDCNVQCEAYPSCGPDQIEVDSCDGELDCEEVSICGSTIYCAEPQVNCLAYPACQPGYIEVEDCGSDTSCYQESICGVTINCQLDDTACDAIPTCPDGTIENPQCPVIDVDCTEVSLCGTTIYCEPVAHCEAYPVCPDNTIEVPECGDEAPCADYSLCGYTISCETVLPETCLALPVCQEGYREVGTTCPANSECYAESVCGVTIACLKDDASCDAIPFCPDGFYETHDCPQDASCLTLSLCGTTILCTDA